MEKTRTIFKKTKILATIGPSVFSEEAIEKLIVAGVNGCRLNCSHGTNEEREEHIGWIRAVSKRTGKPVAIVQDLQGPKIRLGLIKDNYMDVKAGDELILDFACEEHDGGNVLPVQYNLAEKVKVGEALYIFDGKIRAKITEVVSGTAIKVVAENDGYVMNRKGLNLPDTDFGGDILTPKDLADIEWGAGQDIDYVAASFIQTAQDIENLRQVLLGHGSDAQIIAKIETKHAIKDDETMEEIVLATDGIMVARGDMAVEAGLEVVPVAQRKLVALCRKHGKLVIVATQVMMNMVENPEPTRAEVNDVATAVVQGADVVMLSDETANGKYPIETVKAVKKVILYTQDNTEVVPLVREMRREQMIMDRMAQAAVNLASDMGVDAIVCETATGATAWSIAANRPEVRIISVTDSPRVAQQLALSYANKSYVRTHGPTYGLDLVRELKDGGEFFSDKDEVKVVIVSGLRKEAGGTDTIQCRIVK
ncbi:pyruvate kinase [Candidatus Saccharibacteria bacterium]|nr:pyruvate kinase [Candidatus Saccharibacteria bacterium]